MKDLREFLAKLEATHAALTKEFETAQAGARKATAECRAKRDALVAFRAEFGQHLRVAKGQDVTVAAKPEDAKP